ncbi:MAG TPA: hotdog domain-containing protein [Terriglobales bacterium]|jgi:predicted thioesterase|nr:hotdog domain-containing protein [Terriglobales bacterium]
MSKPVPIGARGEASETVEHKHTLTYYDKRLPPVYSTPDMVRLMEIAGLHAMQPYVEGDEITVGTAINIEHRAAALLGAKVSAEAIVEKIDGRFYTLRVRAWDEKREIGSGTIGRTFVSLAKITARVSAGG